MNDEKTCVVVCSKFKYPAKWKTSVQLPEYQKSRIFVFDLIVQTPIPFHSISRVDAVDERVIPIMKGGEICFPAPAHTVRLTSKNTAHITRR